MSSVFPATEVLVVADCWQMEPEAEAVIHRAIEAAAELTDADVGEAELAVMLTDDTGIQTIVQDQCLPAFQRSPPGSTTHRACSAISR